VRYEVEKSVGSHVFDLFLPDLRTLVEFDGPYHRDRLMKERDAVKDRFADQNGLKVIRITVPSNVCIDSAVIVPYIGNSASNDS
jgi:very-short-patch-repair endonuclease